MVFSHMNVYEMLPMVIIKKDQNKTSLALEKVHVSMQEYDMNRYDYQVD